MADNPKHETEREQRFREACALQAIEGNPLTPEEIAMFEKFSREGWSDERVIAYLTARARETSDVAAE